MNRFKRSLVIASLALASACSFQARATLQPGDAAPDFTAPAWLAGEPFEYSLSRALRDGPVVLYFFPAANTPGCNVEAALFSQAIDDFKARGVSVIGVTAGNIDQLRAFSADTATCAGRFPVAADEGAKISARYSAVMERNPERSSRTSYLIDRNGRVLAVHSDMNPAQHVKRMLESIPGDPD
ncbi:peroxiredoxin [Luteimonas granuli]|uniref:thioredoxin-dependent peroxiredoxin n=1 Tax=Luteimonas granuli TaxID=1176533 RepID=A0A518N6R2_9GAMM|nr:peroxiredoxin [Luteimonas granuli]QDW67614.1 peroxiredoxin [Luteimonas granuli]